MHFKAIEAHLKQNGRLPVNMKIILEGEEEVGSANLDNFVKAHKDELAADVVVISDSPMFDRGIPSICYGLRGLVYFQIDLRGTKSDLHSGSFGGAVANPAMVLAQILAQMKDRGGRIKIPGFYDDVRELQRRGAGGVEEAAVQRDGAIARSSARRSCSARAATRRSSASGRGRPSRSTACSAASPAKARRPSSPPWRWPRSACASCRIRIRTRSRSCSRSYVKKVAPKTVELKVTRMHGGKPWMTEFDNPFVQAAGRAIEKGFGKAPVFNREGGSIPVVATFQEILGLPSVLFGVGLPDENAHAPNEKLDLGNFHGGIIASALSLRRDRQDALMRPTWAASS